MGTAAMRGARWLGPLALLLLLASGIVIALSAVIDLPVPVLVAALAIAAIAMMVVAVDSIRTSRTEKIGMVPATGRLFKDIGSFILWFF